MTGVPALCPHCGRVFVSAAFSFGFASSCHRCVRQALAALVNPEAGHLGYGTPHPSLGDHNYKLTRAIGSQRIWSTIGVSGRHFDGNDAGLRH
jgi:hypothetical protein